MKDSYTNPEIKDSLLVLAEEHFNILINRINAEGTDPKLGYLYCRLGEVKFNQKKYIKAERAFVESLHHLVIRGEYCEDRARAHIGLARTYMKLANEEGAREHFIRAIHIYDSLSMYEVIEQLTVTFKKLSIKLEDILPAKAINEQGIPTKCRECSGSEFKKIRVENEKVVVYDCVSCGCRTIVVLDMLELSTTPPVISN